METQQQEKAKLNEGRLSSLLSSMLMVETLERGFAWLSMGKCDAFLDMADAAGGL